MTIYMDGVQYTELIFSEGIDKVLVGVTYNDQSFTTINMTMKEWNLLCDIYIEEFRRRIIDGEREFN